MSRKAFTGTLKRAILTCRIEALDGQIVKIIPLGEYTVYDDGGAQFLSLTDTSSESKPEYWLRRENI